MKTMYGRQFATMVSMVLLSFLMLGASFATLSYQYTIREKKDTLERNARVIAGFTSESIQATAVGGGLVWKTDAFQSYLASVAKVSDTHVMVATPDGQILYATAGDGELTGLRYQQIPRDMAAELPSAPYVGMSDLGGLYGEARYLVGLPITDGAAGHLQGLVLVSCAASNISGMWQDLSAILLVTALAVILIAAIISSVTSMRQSQPIKEIAAAARQFGLGELDVRVDVGPRRDEVGELAEAFNAMADSLSKSEQRRTEFVANVSHELKTPMTTIAGFADGILDGTIPPQQERHYLQIISSETRRLSRLVRSMLDLSRLQFMISVVVYLLCVVILPRFGFAGMVMRIYPCLAAGYFILFQMYAEILFLYYFKDLWGAIFTSASFCLVTFLGSLVSTRLPDIWFGTGVVVGSFLAWCIGYMRLRWVERNMDRQVFCQGTLIKPGRRQKRPSDQVYGKTA